MLLESATDMRRQTAQNKIAKLEAANGFHLDETKERGREALLGGVVLAITGTANILNGLVDWMPTQWHPYVLGASAVSGYLAASGLAWMEYESVKAKSMAREAIAIATLNEIPLPEWTHPYLEANQVLAERDKATAAELNNLLPAEL